MADFWQTFFAESITKFSGYNIVNTVVYLAILLIVAFFVVFPFLNRRGIIFNYRFAWALLPFVLLGSSARVLEDLRLVPRSANPFEWGYYTISPGIYIAVGFYAVAMLLLSGWLAKRLGKNHLFIFAAIGLLSALPFVAFDVSRFVEINGFLFAVLSAFALSVAIWASVKAWKPDFAKDKLNFLALAGQALEGTTVFVATQFFSCGQAHEFSNIILGTVPLAFPLLKIALILAVLRALDTETKNENLRGFIKLVLIILSFAMGTRNALTLAVGTCS